MASLPQPMGYYPTSNSIMHAQPATTSRGSFGPVFTVLAVITFLAVAACVVGRLCGRRLSKKRAASAEDQFYGINAVGGDLEKGFEIKYPVMKPMASSRAMIHDIDDGFEIKFTPGKPAAWKNDSKGDGKGHQQQHQQHQHQHHPQQHGMPQHHPQHGMPMPPGFRYPANVVRQGQIRGGTFISAKPST
ncbi:uncharacterized protein [Oryza sativa Japonica Group]|uniref:Os02g0708000 protein n=7 Tax=Oryza TaxID=4527 RepID=Q8S3R6_ORYSJ|nr:uncharacterized protein LOC4330473 [Oryza sativa Japonica Group]XP_052143246.1 uncharacterized protein LOC127762794 [Oryza glaberrima]EAY87232.1 hypothetical protein OsI_08634 [Oryza sativa Indica Group]KAB8088554.1 hypothetical protein EE612_013195 [Oryza sativa]AAL87162.1 unknown [Oryza sativa Japonica Group]EAZ24338.1 hypothetical protein OsJ_08091 [Oryza sativa Japonica Group]KAF2946685.1 hypothetical protein DAI22_02g303900 [Oryza sativa Japonica Group]|eukprot:NP_001047878.1 Os02g0708000 [Oryza sativa Japonica Group]